MYLVAPLLVFALSNLQLFPCGSTILSLSPSSSASSASDTSKCVGFPLVAKSEASSTSWAAPSPPPLLFNWLSEETMSHLKGLLWTCSSLKVTLMKCGRRSCGTKVTS